MPAKLAATLGLMTCGCAFLLDFEQYERDCSACSDALACVESECTRNGCIPEPKNNPACEQDVEAEAGPPRCAGGPGVLAPVMEFQELEARSVLQVEVTLTPTHVIQTALISNEPDSRDLIIRAFALDGEDEVAGQHDSSAPRSPSATFALSSVLPEGTEVLAPGVVVVTPDGPSPFTLFTAVWRPEVATTTGDVVRLDLDENLEAVGTLKPLTGLPNFQVNDSAGRAGPAVGQLENGEPFVVWQGCRPDPEAIDETNQDLCASRGVQSGHGAIYAHTGNGRLDAEDLAASGSDENLFTSSLQALSGGVVPAAVWVAAPLNDVLDVRTGLPTVGGSSSLTQCDTSLGTSWLSTTRIWGPNSGVAWTKIPDGAAPTAEATAVRCTAEACEDRAIDADTGGPLACGALVTTRVFADMNYLSHSVLATSSVDESAHTLAAFVTNRDGQATLVASLTRGVADPNQQRPLSEENSLVLSTNGPMRVVTGLRGFTSTRAGAAVSWIERGKLARLKLLDVCL